MKNLMVILFSLIASTSAFAYDEDGGVSGSVQAILKSGEQCSIISNYHEASDGCGNSGTSYSAQISATVALEGGYKPYRVQIVVLDPSDNQHVVYDQNYSVSSDTNYPISGVTYNVSGSGYVAQVYLYNANTGAILCSAQNPISAAH